MKILPNDHVAIEALRCKQDQNALCIGMMEVEFEDELKRAMDDDLRRGALMVERENRRSFLMQTVHTTRLEQKAAGEKALRAVGIDPDSGEYSIDGREVRQLVGGRWVAYETAQHFVLPKEV